jgi:hypothetical protein
MQAYSLYTIVKEIATIILYFTCVFWIYLVSIQKLNNSQGKWTRKFKMNLNFGRNYSICVEYIYYCNRIVKFEIQM